MIKENEHESTLSFSEKYVNILIKKKILPKFSFIVQIYHLNLRILKALNKTHRFENYSSVARLVKYIRENIKLNIKLKH